MERNEKDIIRLKVALVFKKRIDKNKRLAESLKEDGKFDSNLITSYRKWETSSGVPIASISEIMAGDRNVSITTFVALINSIGMTLEIFGREFDALSDQEAIEYLKANQSIQKNKRKSKK